MQLISHFGKKWLIWRSSNCVFKEASKAYLRLIVTVFAELHHCPVQLMFISLAIISNQFELCETRIWNYWFSKAEEIQSLHQQREFCIKPISKEEAKLNSSEVAMELFGIVRIMKWKSDSFLRQTMTKWWKLWRVCTEDKNGNGTLAI